MASQTTNSGNFDQRKEKKLPESNQQNQSHKASQKKPVEGSATGSSTMDGIGGTGSETTRDSVDSNAGQKD